MNSNAEHIDGNSTKDDANATTKTSISDSGTSDVGIDTKKLPETQSSANSRINNYNFYEKIKNNQSEKKDAQAAALKAKRVTVIRHPVDANRLKDTGMAAKIVKCLQEKSRENKDKFKSESKEQQALTASTAHANVKNTSIARNLETFTATEIATAHQNYNKVLAVPKITITDPPSTENQNCSRLISLPKSTIIAKTNQHQRLEDVKRLLNQKILIRKSTETTQPYTQKSTTVTPETNKQQQQQQQFNNLILPPQTTMISRSINTSIVSENSPITYSTSELPIIKVREFHTISASAVATTVTASSSSSSLPVTQQLYFPKTFNVQQNYLPTTSKAINLINPHPEIRPVIRQYTIPTEHKLPAGAIIRPLRVDLNSELRTLPQVTQPQRLSVMPTTNNTFYMHAVMTSSPKHNVSMHKGLNLTKTDTTFIQRTEPKPSNLQMTSTISSKTSILTRNPIIVQQKTLNNIENAQQNSFKSTLSPANVEAAPQATEHQKLTTIQESSKPVILREQPTSSVLVALDSVNKIQKPKILENKLLNPDEKIDLTKLRLTGANVSDTFVFPLPIPLEEIKKETPDELDIQTIAKKKQRLIVSNAKLKLTAKADIAGLAKKVLQNVVKTSSTASETRKLATEPETTPIQATTPSSSSSSIASKITELVASDDEEIFFNSKESKNQMNVKKISSNTIISEQNTAQSNITQKEESLNNYKMASSPTPTNIPKIAIAKTSLTPKSSSILNTDSPTTEEIKLRQKILDFYFIKEEPVSPLKEYPKTIETVDIDDDSSDDNIDAVNFITSLSFLKDYSNKNTESIDKTDISLNMIKTENDESIKNIYTTKQNEITTTTENELETQTEEILTRKPQKTEESIINVNMPEKLMKTNFEKEEEQGNQIKLSPEKTKTDKPIIETKALEKQKSTESPLKETVLLEKELTKSPLKETISLGNQISTESPLTETISCEKQKLTDSPLTETISLEKQKLTDSPLTETISLEKQKLTDSPLTETISREKQKLTESPLRENILLKMESLTESPLTETISLEKQKLTESPLTETISLEKQKLTDSPLTENILLENKDLKESSLTDTIFFKKQSLTESLLTETILLEKQKLTESPLAENILLENKGLKESSLTDTILFEKQSLTESPLTETNSLEKQKLTESHLTENILLEMESLTESPLTETVSLEKQKLTESPLTENIFLKKKSLTEPPLTENILLGMESLTESPLTETISREKQKLTESPLTENILLENKSLTESSLTDTILLEKQSLTESPLKSFSKESRQSPQKIAAVPFTKETALLKEHASKQSKLFEEMKNIENKQSFDSQKTLKTIEQKSNETTSTVTHTNDAIIKMPLDKIKDNSTQAQCFKKDAEGINVKTQAVSEEMPKGPTRKRIGIRNAPINLIARKKAVPAKKLQTVTNHSTAAIEQNIEKKTDNKPKSSLLSTVNENFEVKDQYKVATTSIVQKSEQQQIVDEILQTQAENQALKITQIDQTSNNTAVQATDVQKLSTQASLKQANSQKQPTIADKSSKQYFEDATIQNDLDVLATLSAAQKPLCIETTKASTTHVLPIPAIGSIIDMKAYGLITAAKQHNLTDMVTKSEIAKYETNLSIKDNNKKTEAAKRKQSILKITNTEKLKCIEKRHDVDNNVGTVKPVENAPFNVITICSTDDDEVIPCSKSDSYDTNSNATLVKRKRCFRKRRGVTKFIATTSDSDEMEEDRLVIVSPIIDTISETSSDGMANRLPKKNNIKFIPTQVNKEKDENIFTSPFVPLKKRWELAQQQKQKAQHHKRSQDETDITDDTTPAAEDDEVDVCKLTKSAKLKKFVHKEENRKVAEKNDSTTLQTSVTEKLQENKINETATVQAETEALIETNTEKHIPSTLNITNEPKLRGKRTRVETIEEISSNDENEQKRLKIVANEEIETKTMNSSFVLPKRHRRQSLLVSSSVLTSELAKPKDSKNTTTSTTTTISNTLQPVQQSDLKCESIKMTAMKPGPKSKRKLQIAKKNIRDKFKMDETLDCNNTITSLHTLQPKNDEKCKAAIQTVDLKVDSTITSVEKHVRRTRDKSQTSVRNFDDKDARILESVDKSKCDSSSTVSSAKKRVHKSNNKRQSIESMNDAAVSADTISEFLETTAKKRSRKRKCESQSNESIEMKELEVCNTKIEAANVTIESTLTSAEKSRSREAKISKIHSVEQSGNSSDLNTSIKLKEKSNNSFETADLTSSSTPILAKNRSRKSSGKIQTTVLNNEIEKSEVCNRKLTSIHKVESIENSNDTFESAANLTSDSITIPITITKKRGRRPKCKNPSSLNEVGDYNPRMLLIRRREQLNSDEKLTVPENQAGKGPLQCGLCLARTTRKNWYKHLAEHYGIGWIIGEEEAIDITNRNAILAKAQMYFKFSGISSLSCRLCERTYRSYLGIFLHLDNCGEAPQHVVCPLCGNNYTRLSMLGHQRTCRGPKQVVEVIKDVATQSTPEIKVAKVVDGRLKRASLLRAEKKLKTFTKELGGEESDFNPKNFIKCLENLNTDEKSSTELFVCTICGDKKRFQSLSNAMRHVNVAHKQQYLDKHPLNMFDFEREGAEKEAAEKEEETDKYSTGAGSSSPESYSEDAIETDNSNCRKKSKKRRRHVYQNPYTSYKPIYAARSANVPALTSQKWRNFINSNYMNDGTLFRNFVPIYDIAAGTSNEIPRLEKILPFDKTSIKFAEPRKLKMFRKFGESVPSTLNWKSLETFQTTEGTAIEKLIYFGAPIKFLLWAPLPPKVTEQYLILTYRRSSSAASHVRHVNPKIKQTLVMVYKVTMVNNCIDAALHYAIHIPIGPVHTLDFLPSGGYDVTLNRLGLLAVGGVQNKISIYALPIEPVNTITTDLHSTFNQKNCQIRFVRLSPSFELELESELDKREPNKPILFETQCTRICWSEFSGHHHIFACFSNGYIAVWNIEKPTIDALNFHYYIRQDGTPCFTPLNYFSAEENSVTCLALHYDTCGPRWLAVFGVSGRHCIYDIRNINQPIVLREEILQQEPRCIDWSPIWETFSVGMCDIVTTLGRVLRVFNPVGVDFYHMSLEYSIGGISQVHFNPWQSLTTFATDNGDLNIVNTDQLNRNWRRNVSDLAVSVIDLKRLDANELLLTGNGVPHAAKNDLPHSKKDDKKCGIVFSTFSQLNAKDYKMYRDDHRKPPPKMDHLTRINAVRWNLNAMGKRFLAVGYENGFLRLCRIRGESYFD